jgi:hypothetical protein
MNGRGINMNKDIEIEFESENSSPVVRANSMEEALVHIVQRKDIDPDRLEKFLDLQIRMEKRQAEQAFNEALAKFQGECPIIKKNRKIDFTSKSGSSTKYDYAPLDEIIHIIKPLLSKNGLSYTFDVVAGEFVSVLKTTISHQLGHSKDFTYSFDTIHDDQRMNISQRRKSALTYAKRAGLENALGIVTAGEDDDARRTSETAITEDQINQIKELIVVAKVTPQQFSDRFKVKEIEELSFSGAKKAINALKTRRDACLK